MLCERCNKKKSTVIYRENISGHIRVLRLCGDCADVLEAAGELEEVSAAFASFSSPLFRADDSGTLPFLTPTGGKVAPPNSSKRTSTPARGEVSPPGKCPLCGSTLADIATTGKAGCAACYDAFGEALHALLRSVHGKAEHVGRTTAGFRAKREKLERLALLRQNLKDAIVSEQYEAAAGLRDEIRALEAETG